MFHLMVNVYYGERIVMISLFVLVAAITALWMLRYLSNLPTYGSFAEKPKWIMVYFAIIALCCVGIMITACIEGMQR